MIDLIRTRMRESICVKELLLTDELLLSNIAVLSSDIIKCLRSGGKIVLCGNGGSASDALHFAGEIVGRFQKERKAWSAVVLNADVAVLTAIANDYGYDEVFARQVEAHMSARDLFIGISTSGNSENVFRAVKVAKEIGCRTSGLLGKDGGRIGKLVDCPLIVPCDVTARVQECHIMIIHILCELVESGMADV